MENHLFLYLLPKIWWAINWANLLRQELTEDILEIENKIEMEAQAILKNCPLSARKMRLCVDLIRNKPVDDALNILKFTKKESSIWLEKVLLSAISNWENKTDMAYSAADYDLYVKTIYSNDGTMLKRFRPAPHGRALRIRKRSNHVTLVVENRVEIEETKYSDEEE
jgi:large subunit ribosomal protein L22